MKKILAALLALVMILSMIPVIASAEDTTVVFNLGANGSASHADGSSKNTYSETVGEYTLNITNGTNMYTGARDAKGNSCIKLGASSKTASFNISVPEDVTSVVINVAGYKAKTVTVKANGTSYALTTKSDNGEYTAITVDTSITKTVKFETTSTGYRAMVNSIEFVITAGGEDSQECTHANTKTEEAIAATCTTTGFTAGVYCNDCEKYIEGHELVDLLPHNETVTGEKAATCTEDGYTQYTCSNCGYNHKVYIDATGHSYVDGVCSACGLELPTDLAGKYYIAAIRSSGNYWYMTNDVGTASTSRYQIVDSGVTTLPECIEDIVETQLFELVAVDGGYVIKTGNQYLGWTKDNSGILVDEANAKVVTIEYGEAEGSYNIHFTAAVDDERYLALNNAANSPWYAWYKGAGNQIQNLYLVPVSASEQPDTPDAPECAHDDDICDTEAVEATCTEVGYTAGVYCNDCESYVSGHEEIPALGHNFVDGVCANGCGTVEEVKPTTGAIDFSSTTQRVSQDTNAQVWSDGTLTLTNNKGASTSNVANYSNPVRFYKSSDVVIEFPGMTKLVVKGVSDSKYDDPLKTALETIGTVTVNGAIFTVELPEATNKVTFTAGAQIRMYSIEVSSVKVCTHVWGEPVLTTAPACAVKGENTYTCTLCGEIKTEPVAALGHIAVDGFCSVCGGEFYTLATSLNEGDSVVLYNPENEVAMSATANGSKMGAIATDDATGFAVTENMAVMQVQYFNETDFYLVKDGKYLTSGATGNSLSFADEATDYSAWYLEVPFEGEDVVIITNRNAKYTNDSGVTSEQSIEYYDGAFTTYTKSTGKAFQMKLYVKAAPVPAVELTHISLNPGLDALGYKAAATNAPEGSTIEISLWVNENIKATKTTDTLRLKNILAYNGGETTIYAKATLKDAQGNVIAESAVSETTMKEAVEAVETALEADASAFTQIQIEAVQAMIAKFESKMTGWNIDAIKAWTAPAVTE